MFGRKFSDNAQAQIDAIGRSHAVIEFKPDGTIIAANEKFLDLFGYQLNDIQGKHHAMLVPADQRGGADDKALWEALDRGAPHTAECKRLARGGRDI